MHVMCLFLCHLFSFWHTWCDNALSLYQCVISLITLHTSRCVTLYQCVFLSLIILHTSRCNAKIVDQYCKIRQAIKIYTNSLNLLNNISNVLLTLYFYYYVEEMQLPSLLTCICILCIGLILSFNTFTSFFRVKLLV